MSIHAQSHPLAGKTVTVDLGGGLVDYTVEDWWDRVAGISWQVAQYNPSCLKYAIRAGLAGLPANDEVVYGKSAGYGHLVHDSELGDAR